MNDFIINIGLALAWSLLGLFLAAIISLLIVRVILGIKFGAILAEIEDRQNAAVGIIFKDVAIAVTVLLFPFTTEGFSESSGIAEDILWVSIGGLTAALFFGILAFVLLRALAGRRHIQETPLRYLRRELIDERNPAFAHLLMACLLVVAITVLGQII